MLLRTCCIFKYALSTTALCAAILPLFFLQTGCSDDRSGVTIDGPACMRKSADCAELKDYFDRVAKLQIDMGRYYSAQSSDDAMAADDDDAGAENSLSPEEYSGTNNQETAVDEADIVKSDGTYLYVLNGAGLTIFKSWPADEFSLLSTVSMTEQPLELIVSGDAAYVFAHFYNYDSQETQRDFPGAGYVMTKIMVFDITDRTSPQLAREFYFDGSYLTARLVDGRVYSAAVKRMYYSYYYGYDDISIELPVDAFSGVESKSDTERAALQYTPFLYERTADGFDTAACPCGSTYIPETANGDDIVTLMAFDASNITAEPGLTSVVSEYPEFYSSGENIYLAAGNSWAYLAENYTPKTYVHKFALGETAEYRASGELPGFMLNQFSMSEYEGFFRAAVTENTYNWSERSSSIYILEDNDGSLEIAGSITDIAPGETMYSARFIGDRGFMVTFLQVDPLFTFDLSDPYNPQMKGELKIPGYSTYLHPVGDNYLLGVGQNASEEGWVAGMQVSLFDVTDMDNPVEKFKYTFGDGWTWSEAMYQHKAFQYWERLGLLAVPVQENGDSGFFNGLYLFKIQPELEEDSISLYGKIDHSEFFIPGDDDWYSYWNPDLDVRRSVFMSGAGSDLIYTISGLGVKLNDLNSLDGDSKGFALPEYDYYVYGYGYYF